MPPRKSETLTEAELRLMDVLWQKGSATVQQVLDALPAKPALAYNSVLTTIRVLENKGYLEHVKDGRAHVYKPLMEREEATRSEIRHLVSRFFKNSHELLVLNILEDLSSEAAGANGLETKELKRLRQLLQARERSDDGRSTCESLAQLSAERILNCAAEGMVIALLAWLVLRALGRQNSGTRFAVWFAALLGIAALPLLGHWTATDAGLAKPSEITMPGFVGALHLCRVVADRGGGIAASGHRILALAPAAQELRAGRCGNSRSLCCVRLWKSSRPRGACNSAFPISCAYRPRSVSGSRWW